MDGNRWNRLLEETLCSTFVVRSRVLSGPGDIIHTGIWHLASGIWHLASGIWHLASGILLRSASYGGQVWHLTFFVVNLIANFVEIRVDESTRLTTKLTTKGIGPASSFALRATEDRSGIYHSLS